MFGIGAVGPFFFQKEKVIFAIKALSIDVEGRPLFVRADLPSFINDIATDTLNIFNDKRLLPASRLYKIQPWTIAMLKKCYMSWWYHFLTLQGCCSSSITHQANLHRPYFYCTLPLLRDNWPKFQLYFFYPNVWH